MEAGIYNNAILLLKALVTLWVLVVVMVLVVK